MFSDNFVQDAILLTKILKEPGADLASIGLDSHGEPNDEHEGRIKVELPCKQSW